MKIKVIGRNFSKTVNLKGETVAELFKQMKLSHEDFVVIKNKQVVTKDEKLRSGDRVKLVSVVSGG